MKTNMKNNTNFKENEEKRNLKMIAQNPCGCRERERERERVIL